MQQIVKWWLDRLGALVLLVVASPLLVSMTLMLLLGQGPPLLYREARVGLHGREFYMLKFRSMLEHPGPHIAPEGDPRVTPLGRWLRRSRLDELPQLLNVLRGEMSLVGPRPLPPAHAVQLGDAERAALHSVRPGITGVSALAFLGEDAELSGREHAEAQYLQTLLPAKAALELDYLARWCLAEDLGLLGATMVSLWSRRARQRSRDRVRRLLAGD